MNDAVRRAQAAVTKDKEVRDNVRVIVDAIIEALSAWEIVRVNEGGTLRTETRWKIAKR